MDASRVRFKSTSLVPEDVVFVMRKDGKKFNRIRELLMMDKIIKSSTKLDAANAGQ